MFERIAVVNRGEPALRLIRAVRELDARHAHTCHRAVHRGGAPAAAVVFSREVDRRTAADPRVRELEASIVAADAVEQTHLRSRLASLRSAVRSEELGEVAAEFEAVHDIERARRVGSVHDIVPAAELRPRLVAAVERGMERAGRP